MHIVHKLHGISKILAEQLFKKGKILLIYVVDVTSPFSQTLPQVCSDTEVKRLLFLMLKALHLVVFEAK